MRMLDLHESIVFNNLAYMLLIQGNSLEFNNVVNTINNKKQIDSFSFNVMFTLFFCDRLPRKQIISVAIYEILNQFFFHYTPPGNSFSNRHHLM